MKENIKFLLPPAQRIWLFLLVTLLCMVVASVLVHMVTIHGFTPGKVRVATILQDIIMFILPAVIVAMMCTRTPDRFLMVNKAPSATAALLVFATLLAAIPAMNWVVEWNRCLSLPESMGALEQWMRSSETNAAEMTGMLFGTWSAGAFAVALMIVSLLAGLSEELYFRGTLQRLLVTLPMGKHLAVWTTAVLFSAMHFQFFGFVPRLLLGAYFGYLVVWTGCLWLPVIAHVLNNGMTAYAMWIAHNQGTDNINTLGSEPQQLWLTLTSVVVTALLIFLTWRTAKRVTPESNPLE